MSRSALAFCIAVSISVPAFAATTNAPRGAAPIVYPAAAKGHLLLIYSPIVGTVLEKGVTAISNPSTGVFCVTPTVALASGALPVVGVEWGTSLGNGLLAFYEYGTYDCSAGQIEVRTYEFSASSSPTASQEVAFTVFVE